MKVNTITYVGVMLILYIGGFVLMQYGLFNMGKSKDCINNQQQYDTHFAMTIAGAVAIVGGFVWQSFMDANVSGMKTTISTPS